MKKVFTIILNWNGKKDTIECLKSLEKLSHNNFKHIVVIIDNASTDDSVKAFKRIKDKSFKLAIITNDKNLGYAGGNNIGIKYALNRKADYIMVLNNDVTVDKNILVNFIKASKSHKKFGILSPKIYFEKGFEFHKKRYQSKELGNVIWYAGGDINWDNVYATNHGVDEVDTGQFDKPREIDFATGTCMFINPKALDEVGLFDPQYFLYLEDSDLSLRMKKLGWKVVYIPSAKLWHKVSRSSAIGGNLNDYFITRNRLVFGMRYANARAKFALLRESLRFLAVGRKWQKIGVKDYYMRVFGKGSWK